MVQRKSSGETTMDDVKKSVDRLATIELIKAGATRAQIREVMGTINNQAFGKLYQAMKKASVEKDEE